MRIVAPVASAAEVLPLAEAGADELYCGLVPRSWVQRFGSSGTNRRIFGNLSDEDELAEVVRLAASRGCRVSLVMNAPHYSGPQARALVELAGRFAALGGDGLIVGDIGVLALLAGERLPLRLHASSLLSCRNREAAALHRDLGAQRVVLPRDLSTSEIIALAAAVPDLEFEAFILNDGCVFEEGQCHTIHLPGPMGGPICLDAHRTAHARADGGTLSEAEQATLDANDARYREWLWYRFSCGFSVTGDGHPFGPCGLCALSALAQGGVAAVKIAGREAPLARKLRSVEMVHGTRQALGQGAAAARTFARDMRGRPDLCDRTYMCYYR